MEYASSLLCLAEDKPAPSPEGVQPKSGTGRPVLADSEVRSPLSQRVLMLLYCPFRVEPHAPRSWSWALRITLVLATFVAACLCIRWPHAAAREHLRHDSGTTQTQFLVKDFTAEPLTFSNEGRVVSYVMPVALPADYVLTVEVLSPPADLAKVRIAGHPLGDDISSQTPQESLTDSANTIEAWHRVRLVRHGDRVTLWIDGREASVRSSPQDTTEWLTFEPSPTRVTQFRNLTVEW